MSSKEKLLYKEKEKNKILHSLLGLTKQNEKVLFESILRSKTEIRTKLLSVKHSQSTPSVNK